MPYTLGNRILTSASSCLIQQKPKPSPLAFPHKVYKAISLNEKRLFRSIDINARRKRKPLALKALNPTSAGY